jgi:hypothetical protein
VLKDFKEYRVIRVFKELKGLKEDRVSKGR